MIITKRKPVTVGEFLVEEFMQPLGLSQTDLAQKTGLPRKHINELCRNRRAVTADTALILSAAPTFGRLSTPPSAARALNGRSRLSRQRPQRFKKPHKGDRAGRWQARSVPGGLKTELMESSSRPNGP
jgi:addiction module HigA family antidote